MQVQISKKRGRRDKRGLRPPGSCADAPRIPWCSQKRAENTKEDVQKVGSKMSVNTENKIFTRLLTARSKYK